MSSFYIKIKLQIEQHLFQKDSQALKNSETRGKGKKPQNHNQRHKIKGELLETSEHAVHSSAPKAAFTFA